MLYLIGIGLSKGDISLKAKEAIEKCDSIYAENYTSIYDSDLSELFGKSIKILGRDETESLNFLEEAKTKKLAFLVIGDPLSATTHFEIISECRKRGIKYEIIHSASVLTAIAETGLSLYKFGKVTSIPKWQEKENYQPKSFYSVLKQNLQIGAHTLLLLDNELSLQEAISYLLQISKEQGGSFSEKTLCVACSCLGTAKQKIAYGEAKKIARLNLNKPHCLIVPAKLHFVEAEFLKRFKVK